MVDVYGGLWFENLVAQDRHFDLQCRLFDRGIIQGIQLRVAHPCYTPEVSAADLPRICARLSDGMRVFVHFGAENCGVDFGEMLDECEVYTKRGKLHGIRWAEWNAKTIAWGLYVADACMCSGGMPRGVAHLGYGASASDRDARSRVVQTLRSLDDGTRIAIENVPALYRCDWYSAIEGWVPTAWSRDSYFGFGGTPSDMATVIASLGGVTPGGVSSISRTCM